MTALGSVFSGPALPAAALTAGLDPLAAAAQRRAWRVLTLTLGIIMMSAVDLYITLLYVRTVGMGEANPLARWVMMHFSSDVLIWWKLFTVSLASVIFITARRARVAEFGAWISCFVLVWLTMRWMSYSDEVAHLTSVLHTLADYESAKWVQGPN